MINPSSWTLRAIRFLLTKNLVLYKELCREHQLKDYQISILLGHPLCFHSPCQSCVGRSCSCSASVESWTLVWRGNNGHGSSALVVAETSGPWHHLLAGNSPAHPSLLTSHPIGVFPCAFHCFLRVPLPTTPRTLQCFHPGLQTV